MRRKNTVGIIGFVVPHIFPRELCGHDYCGREPALPAFSTGAHPLKCAGAVSCFLVFEQPSSLIPHLHHPSNAFEKEKNAHLQLLL